MQKGKKIMQFYIKRKDGKLMSGDDVRKIIISVYEECSKIGGRVKPYFRHTGEKLKISLYGTRRDAGNVKANIREIIFKEFPEYEITR